MYLLLEQRTLMVHLHPLLYPGTVVDFYINTMKTTFLFKSWFLTSFFQILSSQVNKEKLSTDSFSLFQCLCICFRVWKLSRNQNLNQSRLQCIDIYDDDCMPAVCCILQKGPGPYNYILLCIYSIQQHA